MPVTSNLHWVLTKKGEFDAAYCDAAVPPQQRHLYQFVGDLLPLAGGEGGGAGRGDLPGFAAAILFNEDGSVKGVATATWGWPATARTRAITSPELELRAPNTYFSEGCRGHLVEGADAAVRPARRLRSAGLRPRRQGIVDIDPELHSQGTVIHTQGWPLSEHGSNGGGWIYHQANGQVSIGFVTLAQLLQPLRLPFQEMQKWKTHPQVAALLKGGKRVSYGARAINDGGLH
ncbi:hypothetical protein AB5I41_13565 [Sphingomonas sp. MMS24-JH45]